MADDGVGTPNSVEVKDSRVLVRDLEIKSKDVAQYLEPLTPDEREEALVNALEVGVFALGRAGGARDLDFVKREIDQLLASVSATVETIPAMTTEELKARLGSEDGGILKPFDEVVTAAKAETMTKLEDVKKLLEEEIDPRRSDSTLAKALADIRGLLDGDRTDSIQGQFGRAVESVSAPDGKLAGSVKSVVEDAVKPIIEQFSLLQKSLGGEEGRAELVDQTTLKGEVFEDEVFEEVAALSQTLGARVEHIGGDNRTGDVLLELDESGVTGISLRVVIEAKDDQLGRGDVRIKDTIDKAMVEQSATAGLLIGKTADAFGKRVGDWYDGKTDRGYFVATTLDYLPVALRFLISRERVDELLSQAGEIDVARLREEFKQVRTSLKKCTEVKKSATKIHNEADKVAGHAASIEGEILQILDSLEAEIRRVSADGDGE